MKFTKVDAVPNRKKRYNQLKYSWEEFMAMNTKVAKIDLDTGEYSNIYVARTSMKSSIKRLGYPIDITIRRGEIYLIRRDM